MSKIIDSINAGEHIAAAYEVNTWEGRDGRAMIVK